MSYYICNTYNIHNHITIIYINKYNYVYNRLIAYMCNFLSRVYFISIQNYNLFRTTFYYNYFKPIKFNQP